MRTLARRLKELETKSRIDTPVMVINKGLDQLTPEEQALLENIRFVFVGTPGLKLEDCIKEHGVVEITQRD